MFTIVVGDALAIANTPSEVNRTPNFGIHSSGELSPMAVATHPLCTKWGNATPEGILNVGMGKVILEITESIAHTAINTVVVMLVFHQIVVGSDAEIRSSGVVGVAGDNVIVVSCLAIAHFNGGEVLVMQVDARHHLVLPVVAKHALRGTGQVESDGHATEQWHAVSLPFQETLCGGTDAKCEMTNDK